MKRLIAAIACLLWIATVSAAAVAETKPLIANGDFQTLKDGQPAGWKATAEISYPEEGGNRFMRLKSPEAGKMVLQYILAPVPAEAKGMELSFRVRYQDIKRGAREWYDGRIMMNFKDAAGKVVKPSPAPPIFKGSQAEWQQRSVKFLVPEGAKTLEVMPCLFQAASGTLDLDDLRLTVLDEAALGQLKAAEDAKAAERTAKDAAADKKAEAQITAQLATGNLLSNGDFSAGTKDGTFAQGWGKKEEGSGITWEEESGKHFMRLAQQEAGAVKMLYRIIPLPAGVKGIELSVRYRTSGVKNGTQMPGDARLITHWLSGPRVGHLEVGEAVKPEPPAISFSAKAAEWTEVSRRAIVPEGATKLQIMPGLWFAKAGTVDLAEIRVKPISESEAQAMIAEADAAAAKKAEQAAVVAKIIAMPAITPEVKVVGNHLETPDGKLAWLQGLSVDSMQWGPGDNILWSIHVAIDEWHARVIRLPVHDQLWFGKAFKGNPGGNPEPYRHTVDQAVKMCAAKGAYLILDLHQFGAPMPEHVEFWKDAAARYKNNPAVIFELFNEPHDIPWEIWRDGGDLSKAKHNDNAVVENKEANTGKVSVGMQALVDAVRSTGANNVVIAGGLAWSYDLSGTLKGYALQEREGGHGIVYCHHNYPWKKGWQKALLDAAEKYPIFITEVGCPEKWEDFSFIGPSERYEKLGPGCTWPADMLGTIQKYKLNWTGFSFHPRCGPMVIKDWDYTPTAYWGVFVKEALAGKVFQVEKIR